MHRAKRTPRQISLLPSVSRPRSIIRQLRKSSFSVILLQMQERVKMLQKKIINRRTGRSPRIQKKKKALIKAKTGRSPTARFSVVFLTVFCVQGSTQVLCQFWRQLKAFDDFLCTIFMPIFKKKIEVSVMLQWIFSVRPGRSRGPPGFLLDASLIEQLWENHKIVRDGTSQQETMCSLSEVRHHHDGQDMPHKYSKVVC